MLRSLLAICFPIVVTCSTYAQWLTSGSFSTFNHWQACAFHQVDTGLIVYGTDVPANGEGGLLKTWSGLAQPGGYIWYEPGCNIEDIDVKVVDGFPYYMAAGHQGYGYSIVLKQYLAFGNYFQFDSVKTGSNRYYRAIRLRDDLVAFTGGGDYLGNGIIDMSADTGATWANVTVLPGQPVSRLHFVNDQLGFAATGGYRRSFNNGIILPDSGAIYRTTNGGLQWDQVYADPDDGFSDVEFLDAQIGVATRNDGAILRTTDGGDTWDPAIVAVPGPYVMTSVTFRPDGMGFASCYTTDGSGGYILTSDDAGASWGFNFSTAQMNSARRIYDLYFFDNAHGYACTHIMPLRTDGLVTEVPEQNGTMLDLFPNPSSDVVTLRLSDALPAQVEFVDATGRVVLQQRVQGPSTVIPVDGLVPGCYVLRVTERGVMRSLRMVLM